MRSRNSAHLMNKLVEHIEKHHPTPGTAYEFTRVEVVMDETGWTRREIFELAREANAAGELAVSYSSGGGKRWGADMMMPEDLTTIGTISSVWKMHHKRARGIE